MSEPSAAVIVGGAAVAAIGAMTLFKTKPASTTMPSKGEITAPPTAGPVEYPPSPPVNAVPPDVPSSGRNPKTGPTKTKVKIWTYNIHNSSTHSQTIQDLNKLIHERGAQVINLQEFSEPKHREVLSWLHSQGFHTHVVNQTVVAWNTADFTKVKAGQVALNKPRMVEGKGKDKGLTRHWGTQRAGWVLLRAKATGQEFYSVSAHTIPQVVQGTSPQREIVKREQFANLARLTKRLAKQHPVFVSGDLNLSPSEREWPKALLASAHLRSNWDWLGTSKFGRRGTLGHRFVDNILSLINDGVHINAEFIERGLYSDHNAAGASYTITSK